ncbi:lipid-A-disaccharide synthase [Belliella kenyensis]|uniref:Lipid-A-disaccharide synthase n=1 Tax=Belliella kenyensis TaxID=1472724 RepID=A0ABV8EJT7_9BACT|nr:lipid-A-disaccharide synthase [Belliella kenyensis]MCH7402759.1 lipid-A-disaccharide synthase [Belliella kenyensis]MDN3603693.1 lipid-A-disaccharide synthase [Belliella kenyensis]
MKYYVISGERSGDLHASNLIKALKKIDSHADFRGMGGDYSGEVGQHLHVHYKEIALMGFLEVLLGFRKVLKYLSVIKKDILLYKPDVIILVDYGGFNMKIAKFAKLHQIPVHYYIPPKVWAWNQKRALKIKAYVDQVYCILPFEIPFFEKYGVTAHYVGNPLLDELRAFKPHDFFHQKNELSYQPIIALLPGSRSQELNNMMRVMIELVNDFPNAQFIIAGVRNLNADLYQPAIDAGIKVIFDQTYDLLHHANAAVVTSGTATLETALFRVPQVVVYKTSGLSYAIAKNLIRVPYISLVNLIADKEVVKELIQGDFDKSNLSQELNKILTDTVYRGEMLQGYDEIKSRIGDKMASEETARLIFDVK